VSAIVFGLLTALAYAGSTITSARASRLAGAPSTVAWVMVIGAVILLPFAIASVPPEPLPIAALAVAALAGAFNVTALLLAYSAYRIGAVGVVSTIASTEGAVAALISVLAGQALVPGSGPALAVVATGVTLAAAGGGHELEEGVPISRARSLRAAGLAVCAALLFGSGLYLTGRASETLDTAWVVLPGRLAGMAMVSVPLLIAGRARAPRRAIPFIVATGVAEILGLGAYAAGARVDIAVTSVLASLFAPLCRPWPRSGSRAKPAGTASFSARSTFAGTWPRASRPPACVKHSVSCHPSTSARFRTSSAGCPASGPRCSTRRSA
jgi:drug/metabolite transporter (DMT)-like permease